MRADLGAMDRDAVALLRTGWESERMIAIRIEVAVSELRRWREDAANRPCERPTCKHRHHLGKPGRGWEAATCHEGDRADCGACLTCTERAEKRKEVR